MGAQLAKQRGRPLVPEILFVPDLAKGAVDLFAPLAGVPEFLRRAGSSWLTNFSWPLVLTKELR